MVTFWFQVCEGACFAHGWRNFDPPCVAPTQFRKLFHTKRITSIRDNSNEEDHIHSFSLPLPSEDGVVRQQPRGVKMRESDSHVSLLELIFSDATCRVCCAFSFSFLFGHWRLRSIFCWRFDDGVRRCVSISCIHVYFYYILYFVVKYIYIIFCKNHYIPHPIRTKKFEKHAFYIKILRRKNGRFNFKND